MALRLDLIVFEKFAYKGQFSPGIVGTISVRHLLRRWACHG
jgi:hypothetical protein